MYKAVKYLLIIIGLIGFRASVFADDWVYPGTSGDKAILDVTLPNGWTVSCSSAEAGKINVKNVSAYPDSPAILDLSGQFKDSNGTVLVLSSVCGGFSVESLAGRDKVAGLLLPETGPTAVAGFYNCSNLATINRFPNTLKVIGGSNDYVDRNELRGAFKNCTALKEIPSFPASLTTIYGFAFDGCTSVTNIVGDFLPDTVTTVSWGAFRKVPVVRDLKLNGVAKIDRMAFRESGIKSVYIGASVTSIGCHEGSGKGGPFYGCTNLTSVVFDSGNAGIRIVDEQPGSSPGQYKSRQVGIFAKCRKLSGTFDTSLITNYAYGAGAHFDGTSISKIILPELPHLPADYFKGMTNLSKVVFTGKPPVDVQKTVFTGLSGRVVPTYIDKDYKDNWAPYSNLGEVTAATSFWSQEWAGNNYQNYPLLIDVPEQKYDKVGPWVYDPVASTISDGTWTFSVTAAGKMLTVGACQAWPEVITNLDFSVHVSDANKVAYWIAGLNTQLGVASSSWTAPYGSSLPTVAGSRVGALMLPPESSFVTIGERAFACCTNMTSVTPMIPDSVITLGMAAFYNTKITGDLRLMGLSTVNHAAFYNCQNLTSVTFSPDLTMIQSREVGTFQNCVGLTNLYFDASMANASMSTVAGGETFKGCSGLSGTLDLSGFKSLGASVVNTTANCFSGTHYDTVIMATNVISISREFLDGMKDLKTVRFLGDAPTSSLNASGYALYNKLSQTITTEVSRRNKSQWIPYLVGHQWNNGQGYIDSAYLDSTIAPEQRPIRVFDSLGMIIFYR